MAISYPLILPASCGVQSITWRVLANVVVQRSPFSFEQQKQSYDGVAWGVDITFVPLEHSGAKDLRAFLMKLKGQLGTFLFGDRGNKLPAGSVSGTPLVDGAGQSGETLLTRGWAPGASNVLMEGDMIQIGFRLYAVLSNASANGSGRTTLDIFPRLREAPGDGETIITSNAKGLFQLASNEVTWTTDEAKITDGQISAMEAL